MRVVLLPRVVMVATTVVTTAAITAITGIMGIMDVTTIMDGAVAAGGMDIGKVEVIGEITQAGTTIQTSIMKITAFQVFL